MKDSSYAWVILILGDQDVPQAVLSAHSLKRTKTAGSVVALVCSQLSSGSFSMINSAFDWTLSAHTHENIKLYNKTVDFWFAELWKLDTFSKIVGLHSGTVVLSPKDELFDTEGLLVNEQRVIKGIALRPWKEMYYKLCSERHSNGCITFVEALARSSSFEAKEIGQIFSYSNLHNTPRSDFLTPTLIFVENIEQLKHLDPLKQNSLSLERVLKEVYEKSFTSKTIDRVLEDAICVVGMACRFPGANSPLEFWNLLVSNRKAESAKLKCAEEFDAAFFNMSPTEASYTDPQGRLLMECSWEAFEDANINPETLRGNRVSVFYGSLHQNYKDMLNSKTPPTEEYLRKYLGNSFGSVAAKLSFFFGWTGTNIFVDNAEASTLVGIDLACKSLYSRESSISLVAGTNLLLTDYNEGKAEGAAVLILKRYSDAIKDKDNIHGFIRGCGISRKTAVTLSELDLVTAMKTATVSIGLDAQDVSYIDASNVDDPFEIGAISQVYSSAKPSIGSVKASIGDVEAVAGIAGVIKILLAMKYNKIPLGPNHNFLDWPRSTNTSRMAAVSSVGVTGTCAHIVLEEPPLVQKHTTEEPIYPVVVTISGKTEQSVREQCINLERHLNQTQDNIWDIAYTSSWCRPHHQFRVGFVGSSIPEIMKEIQNPEIGMRQKTQPKICFTFPGITGKMNFESIKTLYDCIPYFQWEMDSCCSIVERIFGASMKITKVLGTHENQSKEAYPLGLVEATIISAQYSLVQLWKHWGITPNAVIGHCLGELPAAIISGSLSIEAGLEMIVRFARASVNALPGSMLAINVDETKSIELISEFIAANHAADNNWLEIACVNSDLQTTVAGSQLAITNFRRFCTERGIKNTNVPVDLAIHSRAMEPVYEDFKMIAKEFPGFNQQVPYISSVSGELIPDSELKPKHYADCFRNPVNYVRSCKTAFQMEFDIYLEIGLANILTKITERNISLAENRKDGQPTALCLPSVKPAGRKNDNTTLMTILRAVVKLYEKGVNINWSNFYEGSHDRILQKVELPRYPFQRKRFYFDTQNELGLKESAVSQLCHPLLGIWVPNASGSWIFLADSFATTGCDIANLLEMMLAAGCAAIGDSDKNLRAPCFPVKVENLTLLVELTWEQKMSMVQTIVIKVQRGYEVSFHTENRKSCSWTKFATGRFYALSTQDVREEVENYSSQINIKEIKNEKLVQISVEENNEILRESGYFCHPSISEALLGIDLDDEGIATNFQAPIKIKKYIHFPREIFPEKLYGFSDKQRNIAYLLNQEGDVLGLLLQSVTGKHLETYIK